MVCINTITFYCSLVQWLKHSRKEYCELCKHRFAFTPSKYVLLLFFQNFVFSLGTDEVITFSFSMIDPNLCFNFYILVSIAVLMHIIADCVNCLSNG